MKNYREVMRPAYWLYIAALLIIPAIILVSAPINMLVGIFLSIASYLAIIVLMFVKAPIIELTDSHLRVGAANIPRSELGAASAYSGSHATEQRGVKLDARAWVMFTGWVDPVVKIDIADQSDPAPYWLVSTRHPEDFVAALRSR